MRIMGGFEEQVLSAIKALGPKAYSTPIIRAIESHMGSSVTPSQVFLTLVRLEEKQYIRGWMGTPTPTRGGKAKRFYELTDIGAQALALRVKLNRPMATEGV